jgi:hypothetical protein
MEKSEKAISARASSPVPSENIGQTYIIDGEEEVNHGNGELKRNLSRRLIHVYQVPTQVFGSKTNYFLVQIISLGSQIGSGLFIATGKALHSGTLPK